MTLYGPVLALSGLILLTFAQDARAEVASLLGNAGLAQPRGALIGTLQRSSLLDGGAPPRRVASLFVDQEQGSLFAPWPARGLPDPRVGRADTAFLGPDATIAARIRHLISLAEAGPDGYDAINHGARRLPAQPPTRMTVAEIYRWIAETPGQPHAIGRYQFIPVTLKRLMKKTGTDVNAVFSPGLQDRLADELLREAGLDTLQRGGLDRRRFMENLAGIWAGLPLSNGKSRYHGFAGNRATMTWEKFDLEMSRIFSG